MNGAESLVHSLLNSGVGLCFANPGTSEMHFVAALDRIPGMRCVLGLQENVVTGAADGYWRMTGKPAVTLLHCGPGLANGLANLHNARRARSGIVNCVGDQASYHRPFDAPLTADTEGLARSVIVVATSDDSSLLRQTAPYTATTIAAFVVKKRSFGCARTISTSLSPSLLRRTTCTPMKNSICRTTIAHSVALMTRTPS